MKKPKERRSFTAEEKLRSILSVWTERRTISEACAELEISGTLFSTWQDRAMESLLLALDPARSREKPPALSRRMEKLLHKRLNAPGNGKSKFEERLRQLQRKKDSAAK